MDLQEQRASEPMPADPLRGASLASIRLVIPVWHDGAALEGLLPSLLLDWPADAIWVVDGGSRDGTADVAKRFGVRFLEVDSPSRARQMNVGAAVCGGDVILFLHADTDLPQGARALIGDTISSGAIGGAFSRRFDSRSLFLRATCFAADWRGRFFGLFFGDQAIFATREGFEQAGRFPDQPLFEDFEFTRRLARHGRMALLKPQVISSGRRFRKKGPIRQTISDFILTIRYAQRGKAIFEELNEVGAPGGSPAILLFLKAPVPGRVKTRLARELGDEMACEIYDEMVQRQLAALPKDWPVEIHFSPATARADFNAWLGCSRRHYPQSEGNLGERLREATKTAFERGHGSVILIGGDCPALHSGDLEETKRHLEDGADVVMGPAVDGGYYLLGLRARAESLGVFDNIPWSTRDVARVTLERVEALNLRVVRLEEKEDVDDFSAYRRAIEAGHLAERVDAGELSAVHRAAAGRRDWSL